MENRRIFRYILAVVLVVIIAAVIGSLALDYNVPSKNYMIDSVNWIDDGSFEEFNKPVGNCCITNSSIPNISASRTDDAFFGNYALNLTSYNQCACTNKPVINFSNADSYLLSFQFRGDNPRYCNWVGGDNKCMPVKSLEARDEWTVYREVLSFSEQSASSAIYFYADSRGKLRTNLYDDLQVKRLVEKKDDVWDENEEYVIKTKADNRVNGELISDIDENGEAYFLVKGEPIVTLQFPWTEIVLIVIMLLIVIRLVFKRDDSKGY